VTKPAVVLDALDIKLLAQVQDDAAQSSARLGAKIGLSATAVQRRLRRLKNGKVIGSTVMVVNPAAVDLGVTTIVSISMQSESAASLKAFQKNMLGCREVAQCYYTAGSADFIVIASFTDIATYEKFASQYFSANKHVRRYSTQIVLQTIKRSLTVSLPDDQGR